MVQVLRDEQLKEVVEEAAHALFRQAFLLYDAFQIRRYHFPIIHQHHAHFRHEIATAKTRAVLAAARQRQCSAQAVRAHLRFADTRVPRERRVMQHAHKPRQLPCMRQLVRIEQHDRRFIFPRRAFQRH